MDYNTYPLPIQSIWIEEDQFLEKVYGFHINQVLEFEGHNSSNDEICKNKDKRPRIAFINSNKPHLGNKNNISLNHITTFPIIDIKRNDQDDNTINKRNHLFPQKLLNILRKNQLLNKFKKSQIDNRKSLYCKINSDLPSNVNAINNNTISAPFQFQHISHGEDLLLDHNNSSVYEEISSYTSRTENTNNKETYYNNNDTCTYDEEYNKTTESTLFSSTNSKNSMGFSAFCTPKLNNTESTSSSRIFDLEKNTDYKTYSFPCTVTPPSSFKQYESS